MDPLLVLLIVAGIWIVIYIIAQAVGTEKLNERGVDAGFPFFLMIKTERLNNFLTRIGKKFPRAFFNLGVVVSFVGMVYGFWLFTDNLIKFFIQPAAAGGVVPIIPGVTISGLPLIYMLVGLAVTLLTHEFAHGLASSKDNIPIKSSGLLFFYVMFGGFVEPDEEAFENDVGPKERMRVLAAGSFANLIWGLIFLILIANFQGMMSIGFNPPSGAYIYEIESESPADGVLEIGDVIIGLNDTTISTWADVGTFMADACTDSQLTIYTLHNTYTIILAASDSNASKGYIGIYGADYWEPKSGWEWIPGGPLFAFHSQQVLLWCFIILVSVSIFNLLPIPMLDGDRLLANGLSLVIKDEKLITKIMWPLRIVSLGILLLSIALSFITGKGLF